MQDPHNISLYPGTGCADGKRGDHVILAPAYNITSDEIRHVVDITVAVIVDFFSRMRSE
jgi:adenosylmethionine-8-amino-7-oxononanoate aminotransferase